MFPDPQEPGGHCRRSRQLDRRGRSLRRDLGQRRGHQHRHPRYHRRRHARAQRGRRPVRPPPLPKRRGRPDHRGGDRQCHVRRPHARRVGSGSAAVASDSTHFGAFDQNLFPEWHSRYGGRGVLIYWHVERKSMAIHSAADQLLRVGGRRDDRGRDAARHHDGGRGQLHRLPRPVRGRGRHHPAARVRPAAADQADQQGPALPTGRRPGRRTPTAGRRPR